MTLPLSIRDACAFSCCGLMLVAGCSNGSSSNGMDAGSRADAGPRTDAAKPGRMDAPGDAARANDAASDASQAAADASAPPPAIRATWVFQGGDDGTGKAYPFRAFELNRNTGALTQLGEPVDLGPSPTYAAPSADGRFLYVANESYAAGVTAASIGSDGRLTKLNDRKPESGDSSFNAMVFTSLSPDGKFVLAANYYGPSVASFAVESDGKLGDLVDSEAFLAPAQSHSVRTDRSGKWAFVPNKDADTIAQLTFDPITGKLDPNEPAAKSTKQGAGPRHIAMHPSRSLAYVINENDSTLTAYRITDDGLLEEIETRSTLPAGYDGSNTGAHVLVHPNGNFVYASNRGDNSIAVFALASDGRMQLVEHESTRGETPRNFDIDARGELLVVANQTSGTLAVFRLDENGELTPVGALLEGLTGPSAVAIVNAMEPR